MSTELEGSRVRADLEHDWLDLDLHRDARVVRDGVRIVGYGAIHDRGESWSACRACGAARTAATASCTPPRG